VQETYSTDELNSIRASVSRRIGWDFSSMRTIRGNVPWDYPSVVKRYLSPEAEVLDVGTGGGELLIELSPYFRNALGVDTDPDMLRVAQSKAHAARGSNLTFRVDNASLCGSSGLFDVILNRQAPYDLHAVSRHLRPGGWFITQQVGEHNMSNVARALAREVPPATITREAVLKSGLEVVEFWEYDVEYIVEDIESLVFWLSALDVLHTNIQGSEAIGTAEDLNRVLHNNVDPRGFVTNEHRYLVVAKLG